jgi:hypothetical protein
MRHGRSPCLARVLLAHDVEMPVGGSNILARCSITPAVLETVIPLTSLHTSLTLPACRGDA